MSMIQSGVIGGVAYDFLKNGLPLAYDTFTEHLKAKDREWLLDAQSTEGVLSRVSDLYHSELDIDQFNQAIKQDVVLAELIKAAIEPRNPNTQTLLNSDQNTVVGGNVDRLTINYAAKDSSTAKKP